jgi:hypothetical protein
MEERHCRLYRLLKQKLVPMDELPLVPLFSPGPKSLEQNVVGTKASDNNELRVGSRGDSFNEMPPLWHLRFFDVRYV